MPDTLTDLPILFDELALAQLPQDVQQKIALVDQCLPQTQCGLCDHPDGCLPYAHAIVTKHERHNKCVPGGQPVSDAIAKITNRQSLPATPAKWHTDPVTQRPIEMRAVIREDDCIGCTKCIPACPVDAVVGTGKHMHTIFTDLCTGCELCLPPCPVDCIDLVPVDHRPDDQQRQQQQAHLRQRYHHHLNRVTTQIADRKQSKPTVSMLESKLGSAVHARVTVDERDAKSTIEAAKLRSKIKKLETQLTVRPNPNKQSELQLLYQKLDAID